MTKVSRGDKGRLWSGTMHWKPRWLRTLPGRARSPLAAKLLRVIFALYFGIALVATSAQLMIEYDNERADLESDIRDIVQLVLPALSQNLWDFEETSVTAIVHALRQNHAVVGVRLTGDVPLVVGAAAEAADDTPRFDKPRRGALAFTRLYAQHYPIYFARTPGDDRHLGTLSVYSSSDVVWERSKSVFYTTIAGAVIKTLALWGILYLVLTHIVARPIEKLALGLNKINQELPMVSPLAKQARFGNQNNELNFLLYSFVSMRRALRRSHRKLLGHQKELEQKIAERTKQLRHQATHDELTGLLNRRAFEERMTSLLRANRDGGGRQHAVCFIDLDHFKLVNDTFGHSFGDQLLRQIGEILKHNTRSSDSIARIGGDEFAIILRDSTIQEAQRIAENLRRKVEGLVVHQGGHRIAIGLSAGLVPLSGESTDQNVAQVMSEADVACYSAKEAGRNQVQIHSVAAGHTRRQYDTNWISLINNALNEDKFVLYFQPIVLTGRDTHAEINRFEVLLRIDLGSELILPDSFMPSAERYNLATRIDYWVISHTLAYLATHQRLLDEIELVHINISATTISDVDFYRFALREFRRYKVPHRKICFEVTETAAISNLDHAARIMASLRQHGILFAFDDFGRGMSSYAYLRDLPVDIVKIDGSFVRHIHEDEINCAIVESLNTIAHLTGKRTVAEFVETKSIMDKLRQVGVDYAQGYHLGKPMPLDRLLERFRTNVVNLALPDV